MIIATIKRWGSRFAVRKVFGRQVEILLIDGGHGEILSADNTQFAAAVKMCVEHVARVAEGFPADPTGDREAQVRAARAAV
jgi:hypothetical protein